MLLMLFSGVGRLAVQTLFYMDLSAGALPDLEAVKIQSQAIQAANDKAFGELRFSRRADIWQTLEQDAEQHLQLQTRKRRAETVMGAETKRQQGIVLSDRINSSGRSKRAESRFPEM